jgi:hypothetical protein
MILLDHGNDEDGGHGVLQPGPYAVSRSSR